MHRLHTRCPIKLGQGNTGRRSSALKAPKTIHFKFISRNKYMNWYQPVLGSCTAREDIESLYLMNQVLMLETGPPYHLNIRTNWETKSFIQSKVAWHTPLCVTNYLWPLPVWKVFIWFKFNTVVESISHVWGQPTLWSQEAGEFLKNPTLIRM